MTIILTKVRIPLRRKDVLRRPRLVDRLHQNLERKLCFVSSPAGYGKTTLLVDYANDVEARVCWYRTGSEDADIVPFVQYFIAAFQQQYPAFAKEISDQLLAPGNVIEPRSMATQLVNQMVLHVNDFTIMVIDDYHLVGEVQLIVDFIETLLEHLPDHVRLLISGRSVYGIPSASLFVRDELFTLGPGDLRFNAQELKQLAKSMYAVELDEEQAKELEQRSDGWIVAIMLAVRSLKQGGTLTFEGSTDQIYAFLAEDVLKRQPAALQQYMLETSILDEFSSETSDRILGITNSMETLRELEERGMFLTRVDTGGDLPEFRYHQLFAEFLRAQLARSNPRRKQALHERAAEWFGEKLKWDWTISHYFEAGNASKAIETIDRCARSIFLAGQTALLSKWVNDLSDIPQWYRQAPRLALNWAKVLIDRGEYSGGERILELADEPLQAHGDLFEITNLKVTRGMARQFQGDFSGARKIVEATKKLWEGRNSESLYWYHLQRLHGLCEAGEGNSAGAVAYLKQAAVGFQRLAEANPSESMLYLHDLAECTNDLGVVFFNQGDIQGAQQCFQDVLEIRRRNLQNPGALAMALNNVGYLFLQLGQYRNAYYALAEAIEIARPGKLKRVLLHALDSLAILYKDLEEFEEAESTLGEATRLNKGSPQASNLDIYLVQADLARLRANFHDALYWLREAARIEKVSLEAPEYAIRAAAVYLDMGQPELGLQSLLPVIKRWEKTMQPAQSVVKANFLAARAYYDSNQTEYALRYLETALRQAAQLGYDHFLVLEGRRARKLMQKAADTWLNHTHLYSLVRRVEGFRTGKAQLVESGKKKEKLEKIIVRAYGFVDGRVYRNNRLVPNSAWRSGIPRALLFYVLDQKQVRKEKIGSDFWPNYSLDKVTSNFHANLWRARNALNAKELIINQDGQYLITEDVDLYYDVADFEQLLEAARRQQGNPESEIRTLVKAVELVKGEYLPEITFEWANERRNELSAKYRYALERLGKLQMEAGYSGEALQTFERLLVAEPNAEEILLLVMKILVKMGTRAEAKARYEAYRSRLEIDNKHKPGDEIEAYYRSI